MHFKIFQQNRNSSWVRGGIKSFLLILFLSNDGLPDRRDADRKQVLKNQFINIKLQALQSWKSVSPDLPKSFYFFFILITI